MKFCKSCGNQNPDEMNFCLECGTPLSSSAQSLPGPTISESAPAQVTQAISYQAMPAPKPKSKILHILIGIFALLFLTVLGGVLIVYFAIMSLPEENNSNSNAETVELSDSNTKSQNIDITNTSSRLSPTQSPTPVASFTPPLAPTKLGKFTVYADSGWQLSDIDVVGNQQYMTTVNGLVDLAGIKNGVSYLGLKDEKTKHRRIYPEYPTGALLMRTRYADGRVSNMQPIPTSPAYWQNFPDETGKLEFCINDNLPANNGGHFTVTVKLISVPSSKSSNTPNQTPRKTEKPQKPQRRSQQYDDSAGDIY
ncbi:MAG: hypothetical protein KatS3mg006_0025 [Pyrinomonadaceae bacterium]|jgi:hypothetical protein|nr:MAG: hypothetical protein KatS3mg006_0025 [Pyrinomonadaceae bacterium]